MVGRPTAVTSQGVTVWHVAAPFADPELPVRRRHPVARPARDRRRQLRARSGPSGCAACRSSSRVWLDHQHLTPRTPPTGDDVVAARELRELLRPVGVVATVAGLWEPVAAAAPGDLQPWLDRDVPPRPPPHAGRADRPRPAPRRSPPLSPGLARQAVEFLDRPDHPRSSARAPTTSAAWCSWTRPAGAAGARPNAAGSGRVSAHTGPKPGAGGTGSRPRPRRAADRRPPGSARRVRRSGATECGHGSVSAGPRPGAAAGR